jgi:hypothetical protein
LKAILQVSNVLFSAVEACLLGMALFGRERELETSERFLQHVRLWTMRFDANCEDVVKEPAKRGSQ